MGTRSQEYLDDCQKYQIKMVRNMRNVMLDAVDEADQPHRQSAVRTAVGVIDGTT
jgi:hypothetical protein